MLRILLVPFLLVFVYSTSSAQHIARLRFEDDFSYLKSDTSSKTWDERLKFMPISSSLNVSVGGEWREQYQNYTNANFGQFPASFTEESPHQWMHRMMLHADFRFQKNLRAFVQLNNTTRSLNPNPITSQLDENQLAVHQWFLETNVSKHWLVRLGRQEMLFGQERFVATKEGPNTRQSFLGITAEGKYPGFKVDAFYVKPVRMNVGVFDDSLMDEEFAGFYAVKTDKKRKLNIDAYYFYLESTQREYVFKKGLEQRHTAGFRLYSPFRSFNYDVEIAHQWGQFKVLDISAWMFVWDFNVETLKHSYIGFSGNYVPGDKSAIDQELNTFNTLFARPPFGQTVALNITNTLNLSPYIRYQAGTKWLATARASLVSRASTADGIFTPNMSPLRPLEAQGVSSKLGVCDIYALDINYVPTKHYFFQAELGFCQAGNYLKDSGPGKNVVYLAIRNAIKF